MLFVCDLFSFFDHDRNACPYYDVFDETYVRLNAMIETMNEKHNYFACEMREFGLLSETNPTMPSSRIEASRYDDCESSLTLESNLIGDAPLMHLEEMFGPSLTSLPFVVPSNYGTLINTIFSALTLLASPLSLAQWTGLQMGEPFQVASSVIKGDLLARAKELILIESCLEEAPFE